MKFTSVLLVSSLLSLSSLSLADNGSEPGNPTPLPVVSQVDINRYSGTWYEIAKLPNSFQGKCVGGTTANYRLLADEQRIEVINQCQLANGEMNVAEGRAKATNAANSKLKVTFAKLFGRWIFAFGGDYWITALDPNYQWVIVGHPTRQYGWILSRTPAVDINLLYDISRVLIDRGYNPCEFETTAQVGGLAGEQPLCKVVR